MQNSGNIHPNPLVLRIFFPDFFLIQSPKRIHYIISAKFPGNRKRKIVQCCYQIQICLYMRQILIFPGNHFCKLFPRFLKLLFQPLFTVNLR